MILAATALAGCGGSGGNGSSTRAQSRESAGQFVTRILREEISGQWAAQWRELHPGPGPARPGVDGGTTAPTAQGSKPRGRLSHSLAPARRASRIFPVEALRYR